jgi:hypothetical protein
MWIEELRHFSKQVVVAGGTEPSEVEIIAHLIAHVPHAYESVVTMITAEDIKTPGLLDKCARNLRNYWVRNFEGQTPTSTGKHHEAYAVTETHQRADSVGKPSAYLLCPPMGFTYTHCLGGMGFLVQYVYRH